MTVAAAGAPGEERRFVHEIGQVGAGEAGRSARDRSQVHVGVDRDLARVDAEDRFASLHVGIADRDLPIEAAGPQQRRIEDVLAVGGRDDDDALVGLEAVHLDEQLVERLLALLVAQRVAAAAAADGIEFVDEHDAGGMTARVAKQTTNAGRANARVHFHEIGSAGEEERHAGLTGNRSRQQRLARSWRADEQHAFRNAAANRGEPARFLEEVDDLLDFVFGFVHACHILEGHEVVASLGDAGPGRRSRGFGRRWCDRP